MARRFRKGMKGFSDVLQSAPKRNLADNSQYWIGNAIMGLRTISGPSRNSRRFSPFRIRRKTMMRS